MASQPTAATPPRDSVNHGLHFLVAWLVLSVIATPLVVIFVGPILPPGNMTTQAHEQIYDNTWLAAVSTPVLCLVVVFLVYAFVYFRAPKGGALVDGPPLREHAGIQVVRIVITSVTVLMLAAFGTYQLLQNGSGGGQGPSPVAVPAGASHNLAVQVIGQQWEWTFRYPSFGGVETHELVLPQHTSVTLHVTSLDVVHSFWAYQLGVKADANPGTDNVAYVQTRGPGTFQIRCAELCGLFHGYMFSTGRVVSATQFQSWAKTQEAIYKTIAKYVPPYAKTYICPAAGTSPTCSPQPTLRGG